MDRPGDIQVLCRLCLVKDQVNIPIFEEQGDIRQIFIKISCCLPVSITKEDNLPKKICDGCSNKLDLLYEFWNTSINAEKTLLTWLGQAGVKDADKTITAVALQIPKAEVEVKVEQPEEIDGGEVEDEEIDGGEVEDFEENDNYEEEEPPPKRARRSAAVKAQMTLANISDDDEDEDIDNDESTTKIEDESDGSEGEVKDPSSFTAIPGTSVDDQPGPSGLGKDGADAPIFNTSTDNGYEEIRVCLEREPLDIKEESLHKPIDKGPRSGDYISFKCNYCDKSFKWKHNLSRHVKRLHSTTNETFKCEFCHESFKQDDYLRRHTKKQHSGEYESFKCGICDKSFDNKENLIMHIKGKHSGDYKPFKCEYCSKSFKTKSTFDRHTSRLHSGNKTLKCESCDTFFKHKDYLINHTKKQHSGEYESFKCDLCDKCFKWKHHLLRHKKIVHTEDGETFKCAFCDKPFKQEYYLIQHTKRHTNTQNERLHTERNHSEDYNLYKCEDCDKSFKWKYLLVEHKSMKCYSGNIETFECYSCHRRFTRKVNLVFHIKSIHTFRK